MKLKYIVLISLSAASLMACNSGSSGSTATPATLGAEVASSNTNQDSPVATSANELGGTMKLAGAQSNDCSGIELWSSTKAYLSGDYVVYKNIEYKAGWWTKGDQPDTNSGAAGSGKVWTKIAECSDSPSPTPSASPTPKPTTSPTPTPTLAPGEYPVYSVKDKSTYKAGTIVYGLNSEGTSDGNLYQCKAWPASGWCAGESKTYAPGTGTAWSQAWDLISSPSPTTSPVPTPTTSPVPEPTPSPAVAGSQLFSSYIELDAVGGAQAAINGSAYKNYNMILFAEFGANDVSSSIPSGYYDMVKTVLKSENAGTVNLLSFGGQETNPTKYTSAGDFAKTVIAQANAYNTKLKADSISAKIDGIDLDLENNFSSDFINTAATAIKKAGFKVSIAPQIINNSSASCTVNGSTKWNCISSSNPKGQVWYSSGGSDNQYAAAINSGNVDYIQAQIYNQSGFTISYGNTTIAPNAPTELAAYAKIFNNLKGCSDSGVSCIPSTTKVLIGEPVNSAGAGTSIFTYTGMNYSSALTSLTTDIASAGNFLDGVMIWSANVDYYSGYYSAAGASYAGQTSSTLAKTLQIKSDPTPPTPVGYKVYSKNGSYAAGDIVYGTDSLSETDSSGQLISNGHLYKCKDYPYSGWCSIVPNTYAPGFGSAWEDAWDLVK